jgi:hypothetical protein
MCIAKLSRHSWTSGPICRICLVAVPQHQAQILPKSNQVTGISRQRICLLQERTHLIQNLLGSCDRVQQQAHTSNTHLGLLKCTPGVFINRRLGALKWPTNPKSEHFEQMCTLLDFRPQNQILVMAISTICMWQNRPIYVFFFFYLTR